ncbi:MAG: hypothetical protein ACO3A2_01105 [Bdellovibrionia bacterium]
MSRFQDILPSQQGWIHELAQSEIHPDAEKLLHLGRSFDPHQLVEESTIDFLAELKEHFTHFARVLNSYSENGSKFQDVKVYALAQSAADFMLFRNQVKLIFSNSAHGVIQISFAQHMRGSLAIDGFEAKGSTLSSSSLTDQTLDLLAQVGPFRDVYWTFQGEKVSPEQVAKFYFSEFIKITRNSKKSTLGNQLLLDQIKALLQEKGLNL